MKVLIADDSDTTRLLVERMLEQWGYEVLTADNGIRAFQMLVADPECRMALLDWVMPGFEGPRVCKMIQSLNHFVYAILLTGRTKQEDIAHALEAGASDYIVKPYQPLELKARLQAGERIVHLQTQLLSAQRLESMGRLASGIAHEINTPIQYVSDNLQFLGDSLEELRKPWGILDSILNGKKDQLPELPIFDELRSAVEEADVAYLMKEIPSAIQQSVDGANRVAKIVSSMKEFAHPSSDVKQAVDLPRAIETTITVARNEWKYAADVKTSFDDSLPRVNCLPGEFNQVILVLVVNAAHAIGEKNGSQAEEGEEEKKGLIRVSTKRDGDWAEIRVSDDGTGIPPEVRDKIFEPFFTTKPVGSGTGQGLAIARSVIVEKHGGTIEVESEVGVGTTFVVRIPIGTEADSPSE